MRDDRYERTWDSPYGPPLRSSSPEGRNEGRGINYRRSVDGRGHLRDYAQYAQRPAERRNSQRRSSKVQREPRPQNQKGDHANPDAGSKAQPQVRDDDNATQTPGATKVRRSPSQVPEKPPVDGQSNAKADAGKNA